MADELHGKRIAILAADGVERVELEQPRQALQDAGATTVLLSLHDGEIKARENDLDEAGTFSVDALVKSASADEYDAHMRDCLAHADELQAQGTLVMAQQLQPVEQARTLREHAAVVRPARLLLGVHAR